MSNFAKITYRRGSKVIDEACEIRKPEQSDIIIFILAGLCILLVGFISIGFYFIAKPPTASLTTVALTNLSYNARSSSPFFKATLTMKLRIENPNFGFLEFPTSKGDILYNGHVVGEMKVKGQQVASYSATTTEVKTEVSYKENQTSSVWFKNDIERRLIILKIGVKVRGEVHLKALNKRSVNLKCLMHLDMVDKVIQHLWCK